MIALLLLLIGSTPIGAAEGAERTRVVLVTFDTLRYDAFSPPGVDSVMSETRAFAARGLTFERFYATTPITQPTHASLFTGLHPWSHGVLRNGFVLADEQTTLAEHLRANGFETHAVVASFALHEVFGFAQGFDTFDDDFERSYKKVWGGQETEDGKFFSLADTVTKKAIAAIDQAVGAKQFFWVHYFDAHDPYGDASIQVIPMGRLVRHIGKPGFESMLLGAKRLYARDVKRMDRSFARLLDRLQADADDYRTHVILTADHGESFGELGSLGHGKRVSPEQVRVPLVIVSPGLAPGVRADVASSVDVPPTILSLIGMDSGPFAGRNLASGDVAGAGAVGMRTFFEEAKQEPLIDGTTRKVEGPWFFMAKDERLVTGNSATVLEEDDPGRPVEASSTARFREIFGALEQLLQRRDAAEEVLDPGVRDALEALGYLQ